VARDYLGTWVSDWLVIGTGFCTLAIGTGFGFLEAAIYRRLRARLTLRARPRAAIAIPMRRAAEPRRTVSSIPLLGQYSLRTLERRKPFLPLVVNRSQSAS